ncbi:MAG: VWA domain-containing protein [Deltaproteobacteria bacterium]|nr:VWA domain-containing protein [Deltaproteobacteria bacterium]MBW2397131.1 VWA domain-containing protein [Deltaproteobacteria bacterium]
MAFRPFAWILLCLGLLLPAASGAGQRVQLVLDGSGSMWGRIGSETKIDIARTAIAEMIDGWDSEVELGLTVYGHRRKGDCSDIETLIPAGPVDSAAFLQAVQAISPKGKTPLSEAVRRAATDLRHHEEKSAVVLVSDGLETCDEDPCAVAAELEASGVDFTVHVVGFDLKEGEDAKLRCIAENTGGNFWLAGDAAGLTDAFTEVVRAVAKPKPAPAVVVQEVIAIPVEEPAPAPDFAGVKLVPTMSEDGEIIQGGVEWRILAPEEDFEGKREQHGYTYNVGPHIFTLAPGSYLVQVTYGSVTRWEEIEVETGDGETFPINLRAGRLKVNGVLNKGGEKLSGVEWSFLATEEDFEGNRARIAYAYNAGPDMIFVLPAGEHELIASFGNARTSTLVTTEAGERNVLTVSMEAAQLRLFGVLAEGATPVNGVEWSVLGLEQNFEGNVERVAYAYNSGAGHIFTIPQGTYDLVAKYGSIARTERITVTAGQKQRHTLDLNGGQLKFDLKPSETYAALSGVEWSIFTAAGERIGYQYNAAPGAAFTLPSGTYRVVAKGNGFVGEVSLEVGPGQQQKVVVIGTPQG